jgi:SAM-dependent methyltransferase
MWNSEKWITDTDRDRSRTALDLPGLRAAAECLGGGRTVDTFLDIGCGFGGLARLVGENIGAREIHGVDIDPRVIQEAKRKGVLAVQQDVNDGPLPYPAGYFDAVMTLGMMDYLDYFDPMIREMNRILAPGGRVLVSLPNLASWHNRLMLLAGYQPRDVEISSEVLAGVPQRPYRRNGEQPAGHIHIPTVRAFRELMTHHGFETQAILAGRPTARSSKNPALLMFDGLSSRIPSLARRFYYVGVRVHSTPLPERSTSMPYECL